MQSVHFESESMATSEVVSQDAIRLAKLEERLRVLQGESQEYARGHSKGCY